LQRDGKPEERGTRGVDFSTGSLGHGLSLAAGMALHCRVYGYTYNVFALMSDGEFQEGMTWEACLAIPNKGLNRICAFIDRNRLQVDGPVERMNSLDPLARKLKAFNWEVRSVDGHDYRDLLAVLRYFTASRQEASRPLMVIADTVKGKGVKEIEGVFEYHAKPLSLEQYGEAERELMKRIGCLQKSLAGRKGARIGLKPLSKSQPVERKQDLKEIIERNPRQAYKEPTATRQGYGNALSRLGEFEKLFVLNADLASACATAYFVKSYPEDAPNAADRRSINLGVQEANMMAMAAALASCGKIPIVNSFAMFSAGRAWEMIRQDISYPRLNVKIIGSHAGAALGEYGVSHQAIEDVALMRALPHLVVIEPSDAIQADALFEKALLYDGPVYFRLGRNPVALIYGEADVFEIGRGYRIADGLDLTLICSGPIAAEALKVARLVKESVRVIDMPTIRPADAAIIEESAVETGWICTVQDHFEKGGLRDEVLEVLSAKGLRVRFDFIALDGFAKSGSPEDLYDKYGLSARRIIEKLRLTPSDGQRS
jgi:transketolase